MRIFLFVFLLIIAFSASGQDLLIKRDGDTIKAVILIASQNEIKYKKYDDFSGQTFTISKKELTEIRYSIGGTETIKQTAPELEDAFSTTATALDSAEIMYALGTKDAYKYYKGYKPAGT